MGSGATRREQLLHITNLILEWLGARGECWHNGGVVTLRLFAQARESAGTKVVDLEGDTVGDVLDEACRRFGTTFAAVLDGSKVWLNGAPTEREQAVVAADEVAVLPPVSGG